MNTPNWPLAAVFLYVLGIMGWIIHVLQSRDVPDEDKGISMMTAPCWPILIGGCAILHLLLLGSWLWSRCRILLKRS